jgi:hypothetical protein
LSIVVGTENWQIRQLSSTFNERRNQPSARRRRHIPDRWPPLDRSGSIRWACGGPFAG